MSAVAQPSASVRTPRRERSQFWLYLVAALLTIFMLLPIYLITIAAFSPREVITSQFPKPVVPTAFSVETLRFFLR